MTRFKCSRIVCMIVAAIVWFFASGSVAGQVQLGKRYLAPLEGFSIRPPAGTERIKQTSASLLVSWIKRDPSSGAIAWTLSVQKRIDRNANADLGPYSNALAERLRRVEGFQIESLKVQPIAGKGAIHLVGLTGGLLRSWQRQTWVLAQPGRFLIFSITGPETLKDEMNATFDAVMNTLQLNDPAAALEAREKSLARGQDLLAGLNDKKLRAIISAEPQWYLFKLQDRVVGFMKMLDSFTEKEKTQGLWVVQYIMLQMPHDKRRLLKRQAFSTADRSVESWNELSQVGQGPGLQRIQEQGLKQAELIVCSITGPRGERTFKKKVPREIYLPRALGIVLPRLIDLSQPRAYGFASYTSNVNSFDLRTITVIGPDTILRDGEKIQCVHLTDQSAADAEPVDLWVDAKGNLLRMKTSEGLVIEASSLPRVLKSFYDAESLIAQLDK